MASLIGEEENPALRIRGKGDADRTVPLDPGMLGLLEDYLATRGERFPAQPKKRQTTEGTPWRKRYASSMPLFVGRDGERLTESALSWMVRSAFRAAGIEGERERGALVHALRHTFATRLIENGTSAVALMELLGHKSLATTQNYVKASGRELRNDVAANPAYARLRRP